MTGQQPYRLGATPTTLLRTVFMTLTLWSSHGFTARTSHRAIVPALVPTTSITTFSTSRTQQRQTTKLHVLEKAKELFDVKSEKNTLQQTSSKGLGASAGSNNLSSHVSEDEVYQAAITRTLLWVGAACAFGAGLFAYYGTETAEEFFAGYLLEQSLSVDNLLVFLLLFEYFKVPRPFQNRVLNWGILGAIAMRAMMIGAGAVAIHQFHAVLLVFAGILLYSSSKVLLKGENDDDEEDLSENQIVQFSNSLIKSTNKFDGDKFFTVENGIRMATPLFLCMVAVEISDVVFAVDSIPAVFGVTENPLVVFTSNMFAIMGLRSLYTILSKAASELKYLEPAVAVILGFIGVKLIAEYFDICVPTELSLGVVLTLLGTGIGASLWEKEQEDRVEI